MIVCIDFETYYSTEYSLSRMTEVDYILDPRFQTILCAVKINHAPTVVYTGHAAVADALARIDWPRTAMLAHNMRFDGAIAAWHFGVIPKLYLCTLSMARALTHVAAGGSSLARVSKYLGLPDKGDEVVRALGKRLEHFTPEELEAYRTYCARDCDSCYDIFNVYRAAPYAFPSSELALIDTTTRMFVRPQVRLDHGALQAHLSHVRAASAEAFKRVKHIEPAVFSSNQKFTTLLEGLGVEVPMKISPTTHKIMPALAKGDAGFKELLDDDTQPPMVQAVLAARLNAKSTGEETRAVRLMGLAAREWGGGATGWLPVPLKYAGARTLRFSGDGDINLQNLKRGSPLRAAIVAPPGMRIVHRDLSQIEARMVAWLAGCDSLLAAFRHGRDVYSQFATEVYGRPITKVNTLERFVGKTSILGLGYGTGGPRLKNTLFIGNGGISLEVTEEEATRVVRLYRSTYPEIPKLWTRAGGMLNRMIQRRFHPNDIAAIAYNYDRIYLPNGMAILYHGLHTEHVEFPDGSSKDEIVYDGGLRGGNIKIYGAKMVENVAQALARIVLTDAVARVAKDTDYQPFLTTHDSGDWCVPVDQAAQMDAHLEREFSIAPTWCLGLPLASEGGFGVSMLDAENRVNQ